MQSRFNLLKEFSKSFTADCAEKLLICPNLVNIYGIFS